MTSRAVSKTKAYRFMTFVARLKDYRQYAAVLSYDRRYLATFASSQPVNLYAAATSLATFASSQPVNLYAAATSLATFASSQLVNLYILSVNSYA
ncbi:hypothetical protein MY10362_009619 [Beauveria mimosiformis]